MDNNFSAFLREVEQTEFETNTTATGANTIQQSQRNILRKKGVAAFKQDLIDMYGDEFDVVETKDGIVIVAENEPGNFSFSWEIKSTIKSIDYDAFIEASVFDEENAEKEAKKKAKELEKERKLAAIEEKRQKKLREIEAKKNLLN